MKKEIISKFNERPKNVKSWYVMWMGLLSLFFGPFFGFFMAMLRNFFDPISYRSGAGIPVGILGVILGLAISVTTIILFKKNYKLGERSYVLWMGFVPAVLVGSFWTFMIIGELLFPH